MGVSRREYARLRGCSESAVRKAIATGRIVLEPDGTIDPEKADAQWAAMSDPARQRGAAAERSWRDAGRPGEKAVPRAAIEAVQETLNESGEAPATAGDAPQGDLTFLKARTANEVLKAQTARVRLGKMKGDLVDRAKAIATVYALARRERDAWVQWPARVAALMAAELGIEAHAMEAALAKHVRAHLSELAEIRVDLGRSV
jgi:hypothetical protein